jgi:hypothetical protein
MIFRDKALIFQRKLVVDKTDDLGYKQRLN